MTWPKGNNCDFLVLPVPSISPKVKQDAMSFICGNTFYFDEKQLKKRPLVCGVEPSNLLLSKRIQLEALFKDASDNGTDDHKLVDYRRYQTPPNRQQSLMKCSAIAHIVASTQRVIDSQVHGYSDGELLSVIFAMLDDTKLDICENHEDRKTYSIPSGSIFLFSGRCRHGGSSYATHNLRIHMFFAKNQLVKVWKKENTVPLVFHCPVTDCVCNTIKKQSFTKSQWYDHWRHVHRDKFGISVGKYLKQIAGSKVYQCSDCLKGFK